MKSPWPRRAEPFELGFSETVGGLNHEPQLQFLAASSGSEKQSRFQMTKVNPQQQGQKAVPPVSWLPWGRVAKDPVLRIQLTVTPAGRVPQGLVEAYGNPLEKTLGS